MPKDIRLVTARYELAVRKGSCARRADRDMARQAENFRVRYEKRAGIEAMVQEVLMTHGVPVILVVQYLNFGRRMAKLAEHCGGASLRLEAESAVRQWRLKGLAKPVLKDICRSVFDVALPGTAL